MADATEDTATAAAASSPPRAASSPSLVFLPLFAPFGISSGYVGVTLAFLLGPPG